MKFCVFLVFQCLLFRKIPIKTRHFDKNENLHIKFHLFQDPIISENFIILGPYRRNLHRRHKCNPKQPFTRIGNDQRAFSSGLWILYKPALNNGFFLNFESPFRRFSRRKNTFLIAEHWHFFPPRKIPNNRIFKKTRNFSSKSSRPRPNGCFCVSFSVNSSL